MFQLNQRVSALTFNDQEREVINQRLLEFQKKKGIVFSSVKELFSVLLSDSLNEKTEENNEVKEVIKEVVPENLVILTENSAQFIEFENKVEDFKLKANLPKETTLFDSLQFAVKTALKTPETIEIEKTVEKELQSNQILITLTGDVDRKLTLLDEISERRFKKIRSLSEKETFPVLCEKMIFNDNIIFNLGGEFYTGFN